VLILLSASTGTSLKLPLAVSKKVTDMFAVVVVVVI
jgi:hypothetical protein